jgi:hypothetical protein
VEQKDTTHALAREQDGGLDRTRRKKASLTITNSRFENLPDTMKFALAFLALVVGASAFAPAPAFTRASALFNEEGKK